MLKRERNRCSPSGLNLSGSEKDRISATWFVEQSFLSQSKQSEQESTNKEAITCCLKWPRIISRQNNRLGSFTGNVFGLESIGVVKTFYIFKEASNETSTEPVNDLLETPIVLGIFLGIAIVLESLPR